MPSVRLEAAILSMQWSQNYALDRTATGIGTYSYIYSSQHIQFRLAPDLPKRNYGVSLGGGLYLISYLLSWYRS